MSQSVDDYEDIQAAMDAEVASIAQELGVDEFVASNIRYLRDRSRWSQQLEDRLIKAAKDGNPCPCVYSGEESEWLDANGYGQ